ncbi:NAD-dependent epimerase [Priestia megaterium]|uniref:NAD-dependent epimerase/dehydratase family protein n=1 Tax=Priestia megaterium TaxID=1404 RepID=UPI000BF7FE01|nr:NAD-dependent epimerase/dehydratase family protein [Priestia megaterium]MED4179731.1 NAD-dependent epimerase/dehydratase family protein [Priestia megaterium]PFK51576.1 NAD-dependent epimerase [Priestia megaterium]
MKKVLITGINSYVGKSVKKWLDKYPNIYSVHTISLKNDSWKEKNLSQYDVVLHVAGIAHVSSDPKLEDLYYKVNRDLTVDIAKKAKAEGVKQFIFMSSIIIYGNSDINNGVIDQATVPVPSNFYGNSKLQAEKSIIPLENDNFKIVILRPPMIYGKGSKGNYPKLANLARRTPFFPNFKNKRSMLHIDNLCEFIRLMINNRESGIFFPQNNEYVQTSELVRLIAETYGKKVMLIKIFNPILSVINQRIEVFNKIFGDLVYSMELSNYKQDYRVYSLRESILVTEEQLTNI